MTTILRLILIVLALVLRMKQNTAGTAACAGLAVILVIVRLASPLWSGTPADRHIEKATQVLIDGMAQGIADRHPGAKVIILGTVGSSESTGMAKGYYETEIKLTKALRKRGLDVESMASLPNQGGKDRAQEMEMALLDAGWEEDPLLDMELAMSGGGQFEGLQELKGRADVVLFNKFMPPSVDPWEFPEAGQAPFLVLMNHPGWEDLQAVFESTALDIVLAARPNISKLVTKKWPRDVKVAFAQRYQLLTPENPTLSR